MAQLTYTQIVGEVGAALDLDVSTGSEGETSVKRYVNWAARRIWTARPWYERRAEVILTMVAPYTTGTATLTNGSTSVTGTTTTWTSAFTGRKIALGYGQPWYRFTRTADGTGTIAEAYAETTATDSDYIIFQDEYDISTTCDSLTEVSLIYQDGRMDSMGEARLNSSAYVHGAAGLPRAYSLCDSTTAGTRRLRVWPIPDATYRIRVHYLKSYTDMSGTTDLCGLGVNKEKLLFKASCLEAQALSDARQITTEAEVEGLIERAWRDQQDQVPTAYLRQGFDAATSGNGTWIDTASAFP